MIKNSCKEHYSYKEMEDLFVKQRAQLEDAIYEKEMYSEKVREFRWKIRSLEEDKKISLEDNEKTFQKLLSKIFPNYWKKNWAGKHILCPVIEDFEDGMLGLVESGIPSNPMKCYMQDESIREIDTSKKEWIHIR